jgi:hypothetical protein
VTAEDIDRQIAELNGITGAKGDWFPSVAALLSGRRTDKDIHLLKHPPSLHDPSRGFVLTGEASNRLQATISRREFDIERVITLLDQLKGRVCHTNY